MGPETRADVVIQRKVEVERAENLVCSFKFDLVKFSLVQDLQGAMGVGRPGHGGTRSLTARKHHRIALDTAKGVLAERLMAP